MLKQKLPPFQNVVANGVATTFVPFANSVNKIQLCLGGTFTKAMITEIRVKLGTFLVYVLTGSRLDAINAYKKMGSSAIYLDIDFTERDAPSQIGKELGAYDLGLISDVMTIEVVIAGATSPTLTAYAWMTPTSRNPAVPGSGNPLIMKMLYIPATFAAGGKQMIPLSIKRGSVKRIHIFHGGQVNGYEFRKNGQIIDDSINGTAGGADVQFQQTDYNRVVQANHLCVDFVIDNNQSGMLPLADAASLEFYVNLAAADTISCYVELIDLPN